VNKTTLHKQESAFEQSLISIKTTGKINMPVTSSLRSSSTVDSLNKTIRPGLLGKLSSTPGFSAKGNMWQNYDPLFFGANWFKNASLVNHKTQITVFCKNTAELLLQLKNKDDRDLIIFLTGREYVFDAPIKVQTNTLITSSIKSDIHFTMNSSKNPFFLMINAGTKFSMNNVHLDLSKANTPVFITTDTSGNSNHSNISFQNCSFKKLSGTFFSAAKASVTDKMMFSNCTFSYNIGTILNFEAETDKKGLYNVEVLDMNNCTINNHKGQIISMLRSGKDESTMGPSVSFFKNIIKDCNSKDSSALIYLYGIQESNIYSNSFSNANNLSVLMKVEDVVRAVHNVRDNRCIHSGIVIGNKYLESKNNTFK
jgi:poly(beta-D-mannuronate) lyase